MIQQQRYQVRFDWGVEGAAAVAADADVLVWVDAMDAVAPPLEALPAGCAVVAAGLAGAAQTAAWVLEVQESLERRTMVAIIAAGAARDDGVRFAVEDLLAAGALLDELERRGIDAMSPEAAAADAAYRGLRAGVRSMFASVVGAGGVPTPAWTVHRGHPELERR